MIRSAIFVALLLFALTPWCTPPLALALGLALALTIGNAFTGRTGGLTKILLQASVVALGFGMELRAVVEAGKTGLFFTLVTIAGTLILGTLLGRAMRISRNATHLIASGTAICGGSAIAAVGPVIGATDDEMSVSLATIFVLNAVALFVFPPIGHALALTQVEFGVWSAIAIHDTSSVVGAASVYGAEALRVGTTIKLTRALWIVPLALATAVAFRRSGVRIVFPWFILLFVVASLIRTFVPAPETVWETLVLAGRTGLKVTLFLIGAGLSRASLRAVGARPLLLGLILWVVISVAGLWAVRALV